MRFILLFTGLLLGNFGLSQQLVSSRLLPCREYGEYMYKERISSQKLVHDTLYLEVNLIRNCSILPEEKLHKTGDSILIYLENTSEIYAACDCCYSMQFTLNEIRDTSYRLFIDQKELKFSPSRYVDLPPLEIPEELLKNETNASGNKIGYWHFQTKSGNRCIEFYDSGNTTSQEPLWTICYTPNKEIINLNILCYDGNHIMDADQYYRIMKEIEKEKQNH